MRRFEIWSVVSVTVVVALIASSAFGASASVNARALGSGSQTFTVNVDGFNKRGQRDLHRLLPERRHGRIPATPSSSTTSGRRAAHRHARHARQRRGERLQQALPRPAEQPARSRSSRSTPSSRSSSRPGPATSIPSGAEPLLPRERRCRRRSPPARTWRAARLRRHAVLLRQRLAEGEPEVHRAPLELDPAGHLPLHLPAPPRVHAGQDHGRPREHLGREPRRTVRGRPEADRDDRGGARAGGEAARAGQAADSRADAPRRPPRSSLGSGAPGSSFAAQIDEYGPTTTHIPVGGSVTWWFAGDHSITFHSNEQPTTTSRRSRPTASVALQPQGCRHRSAAPVSPPSPRPAARRHTSTSSSSPRRPGTARASTTPASSSTPTRPTSRATSSPSAAPGTYKFICTVHDNMKGTIVVGG